METFICNYDLTFFHPVRKNLYSLIQNSPKHFSFQDSIEYDKSTSAFTCKASATVSETSDFSFVDEIKSLSDSCEKLDIGGSFNDNYGRGFITSLFEKQYTSTH